MSNIETRVRAAAAELHAAIAAALDAGLAVTWPGSPADLPGIAISETGRVKPAEPAPAAQPAAEPRDRKPSRPNA